MPHQITPLISSDAAAQIMAGGDSYRSSRRLHLLFENHLIAGGMGGAGLLLVTLLLYRETHSATVLLWGGMSMGVSALQLASVSAYRRHHQRMSAANWLQIHNLLSFCAGSALSYLAISVFAQSSTGGQMLIFVTITGLIAGAISVEAGSVRSFALFAYPPGLALAIVLLNQPDQLSAGIAALIVFFLIGMTRSCNEISKMIDANLELSEALHQSATNDTLVGLTNRAEFMRRLNIQSRESQLSNTSTALIFIDLDNFKKLNDNLGQVQGDRALEQVGEVLRANIRKSDLAARLGGDEFVVLLTQCDTTGAQRAAAKLLGAIRRLNIDAGVPGNFLGASIGVCVAYREFQAEPLMVSADAACYEAKRGGRNQIKFREYQDNPDAATATESDAKPVQNHSEIQPLPSGS
ncbi:MAG: GGDEF domain-containing protein [Burkholderiaceae bacterium]